MMIDTSDIRDGECQTLKVVSRERTTFETFMEDAGEKEGTKDGSNREKMQIKPEILWCRPTVMVEVVLWNEGMIAGEGLPDMYSIFPLEMQRCLHPES